MTSDPGKHLTRATALHLATGAFLAGASKPPGEEYTSLLQLHEDATYRLFRTVEGDEKPLGVSCSRMLQKSKHLFKEVIRLAGHDHAEHHREAQSALERELLREVAGMPDNEVRNALSLRLFGTRSRRDLSVGLAFWKLRHLSDWNDREVEAVQLHRIVDALCDDATLESVAVPATARPSAAGQVVLRFVRSSRQRHATFLYLEEVASHGQRNAEPLRKQWDWRDFQVELTSVVEVQDPTRPSFQRHGATLRILDPSSCTTCGLLRPARIDGCGDCFAEEERQRWEDVVAEYTAAELQELGAVDDYHPKHNPDPQEPEWCEDCLSRTVFPLTDGFAVCTDPECRAVHRVVGCPRCGEAMLGATTRDGSLCDTCQADFERYMAKD